MRRQCRPFVVLVLLCVPAWAAAPANPESEAAGPACPLTPRQERVNRMMGTLERMLLSLARSLEETEPARAERLVEAFQQSKELLIEKRMAEIVRLLEQARLDGAAEEQEKILGDLRALVELLLDEGVDPDELREEIERLRRWREAIERLVEEEEKHLRESRKVADKDETLAELEPRIKAVERLLQREESLVRNTAAAPDDEAEQLDKLAADQAGIRNDTQSLADEIGSASAAPGGSPNASQQGGRPGEDNQPPQGDAPAADKKDAPPGAPSAEPGEGPLRASAAHQQSAEKQLEGRNRQAAQGDEEEAAGELRRALAELRKERDRLQGPPEKVFPPLAKDQDATAQKTGQLRDEMAKSSKSGASSGGGQCGQKQVAGACQCMQQASGQLKKQQPRLASKEQDKAVDELNRALDEIDERLAELAEKMKDEVLVRLEDIFREMLDRQRAASGTTVELHGKRDADGKLRRADRLALSKLAEEQRDLAEMAREAYDLLIEDATSIVFPTVVEDMRDGLHAVAKLLDGRRTGEYTQTRQKEIETTLEELIDALQKASGGGGGGGGGNCQGRPPLVTPLAELKLLRALQLRVNRRTKAFDKARPAKLDDVMQAEIANIAELQGEVSEMVERIVERMP